MINHPNQMNFKKPFQLQSRLELIQL